MKPRILILDDEPEILENLRRMLGADYDCLTRTSAATLGDDLRDFRADVMITDLRMPGVDGMAALAVAHRVSPDLPVILITAFASVGSAVEAVQKGAFDYLAKPFATEELTVAIERAIRFRNLARENADLRRRLASRDGTQVLGSSPAFVRVLDTIQRVGPATANVLVTGESGTGKELAARALHNFSDRRNEAFVPVDCAALPEGLLESELFGHQRGAFTGAVADKRGLLVEADGGTVFLDEIAELPLTLQSKLLRMLETREVRAVGQTQYRKVNVRIVAATNRDIETEVAEGRFREDLFYRLNVVRLHLPPLRERAGDVPLLTRHFVTTFSESARRPEPEIGRDVWNILRTYSWPGNVRQLRNLVEQLVVLAPDGQITPSDLPPEIRFADRQPTPDAGRPTVMADLAYEEARDHALHEFRLEYVRAVLARHGGNVTQAAKAAGVSRRSFHRWLHENRETELDGAEG